MTLSTPACTGRSTRSEAIPSTRGREIHTYGVTQEYPCTLDWERGGTDKIHRLFDLARRESDFALEAFLHSYVAEQMEEEQWSGDWSALAGQLYERLGELFMRDHQ